MDKNSEWGVVLPNPHVRRTKPPIMLSGRQFVSEATPNRSSFKSSSPPRDQPRDVQHVTKVGNQVCSLFVAATRDDQPQQNGASVRVSAPMSQKTHIYVSPPVEVWRTSTRGKPTNPVTTKRIYTVNQGLRGVATLL